MRYGSPDDASVAMLRRVKTAICKVSRQKGAPRRGRAPSLQVVPTGDGAADRPGGHSISWPRSLAW